MCGDEIQALNKNVALGKCACHCEFNDFPISKILLVGNIRGGVKEYYFLMFNDLSIP